MYQLKSHPVGSISLSGGTMVAHPKEPETDLFQS
jgi:hypothetical protein